MKKTIVLWAIIALLFPFAVSAQDTMWEKCYGSFGDDYCFSIKQAPDNTLIFAGGTSSQNYTHALSDFHYVKADSAGNKLWDKTVGGYGTDTLYSVTTVHHGSYPFVEYAGTGITNSPYGGDIYENKGGYDHVIDMVTTKGIRDVDVTFGGVDDESGRCIIQNPDDGFTTIGWTSSHDTFDVTKNHGKKDVWLLRTSYVLIPIFSKCFGGTGDDIGNAISPTSDGGYIFVGSTTSTDGDVIGNHHGGTDAWIVKIDAIGKIQWQVLLGGTGEDVATKIVAMKNGNYMVTGYTNSNDGDFSGHGGYDYFIAEIGPAGQVWFTRCYGGTGDEFAQSIIETNDSNFVVAGFSNSNDFNVSGNHGGYDYWVLNTDDYGNIKWQKSLGGSADDKAYEVVETYDGNFVIGGTTWSYDRDVSLNNGPAGTSDFWVVKLGNTTSGISEIENSSIKIFPNPVETFLNVGLENNSGPSKIIIYDAIGQKVLEQNVGNEKNISLDVSSLPTGSFVLSVLTDKKSLSKMFIHN